MFLCGDPHTHSRYIHTGQLDEKCNERRRIIYLSGAALKNIVIIKNEYLSRRNENSSIHTNVYVSKKIFI